ncbi:MAG: GNAT family N-acetyltransferase [Bacilli bacterium]|nr:GNAT family N-acetyltransferase [Bacilli bacterium]
MNIIIRKANVEDSRGIVEVKMSSWLTTYKGLMPDEVLKNRQDTIEERIPRTESQIREYNNIYVAVDNDRVIGTMSYGESRNEKYKDYGEINFIYLLDEYKGQGIGKKLFMTGIKELIDMGYNSMILNVLEGNKTIGFYEKYSGKKIEQKEEVFYNTPLVENIMLFEDLNKIYEDNK